jgi:hypothetical protein
MGLNASKSKDLVLHDVKESSSSAAATTSSPASHAVEVVLLGAEPREKAVADKATGTRSAIIRAEAGQGLA